MNKRSSTFKTNRSNDLCAREEAIPHRPRLAQHTLSDHQHQNPPKLTYSPHQQHNITSKPAAMPPLLHIMRHGQGYHNISDNGHDIRDPDLTDQGREQCRATRDKFQRHDQVIFLSFLTRLPNAIVNPISGCRLGKLEALNCLVLWCGARSSAGFNRLIRQADELLCCQ